MYVNFNVLMSELQFQKIFITLKKYMMYSLSLNLNVNSL